MRGLVIIAGLLLAAATSRADEGAAPSENAGGSVTTTESVDAVEAEPEAPPITLETGVTGYLDSRVTVQRPRWEGLLPTRDVPVLANITELDTQLKLHWGDRASAMADTSFFEQGGGNYYVADANGDPKAVGAHDVPALRPLAVVSELYAIYNAGEHLNVTLGKKRIVWGPGFAVNPTDLLNPPKDPTDPTYQRAGSWLGRVELPFESFTLSLVGAAKVLRQYGGLPSALLYYPEYDSYESVTSGAKDDRDGMPHFAAAARAYALLADTDVNVYWYFTNRYNDAFEHKNRAGASASHVWGGWELHGELLGQLGNQRMQVNGDCVADSRALTRCLLTRPGEIAKRTRIDDDTFVAKALAGARYTFEDNAMLQLEYYFNGEGYTADEFANYVRAISVGQELAATNAAMSKRFTSLLGQSQPDPGTPQKFTFDSQRRHYAFVSYQQPQIHDDFTLNVVLLLNLQDLSGQLAPSLAWSAREWVTLTAGVFMPVPGLDSLGVDVGGKKYTEYGLLPTDWRGYVSARLFY